MPKKPQKLNCLNFAVRSSSLLLQSEGIVHISLSVYVFMYSLSDVLSEMLSHCSFQIVTCVSRLWLKSVITERRSHNMKCIFGIYAVNV